MKGKVIEKQGFCQKYYDLQQPFLNTYDEDAGAITLRPWQNEYSPEFDKWVLEKSLNIFGAAPTGGGKSAVISYCSDMFLNRRKNSKVIICVPTRVIARGFSKNKTITGNSGDVAWKVLEHNDLANGSDSEQSKCDKFISFLENARVDAHDSILLCTHATLINSINWAINNSKESLIHNVMIWLDESHHSASAENEYNELGKVVNFLVDKNSVDPTVSIGAFTATPFRTDKSPLIPESKKDRFGYYYLPYDRHFTENCNGLTFTYNFLLHDKTWLDTIEHIFKKDPKKKTLIFVPQTGSRMALASKQLTVNKIIDAIAGQSGYGKGLKEDKNGVYCVKKGNDIIRVIDVVDDTDLDERSKKCDYIYQNPEMVDVVIGMRIPKEGFDWTPCTRAVLIGPKDSLNELIQMIGRTFRQHPTKDCGATPVEICHVFPWLDMGKFNAKLDKHRDQLNNFIKAIHCSLILEFKFVPVDVNLPSVKKALGGGIGKHTTILDLLPKEMTEEDLHEMIEECQEAIMSFKNYNPAFNGDWEVKEKEIVVSVVKEWEVSDDLVEAVSDSIIAVYKRRTKQILQRSSGMDLSSIDANLLKELSNDPVGFYGGYCLGLGTDKVSASSLDAFRVLIRNADSTWIKNYTMVKCFVTKNHKYPSKSGNKFLCDWVVRQRTYYRMGLLSESQVNHLLSIPNWKWETDLDKRWQSFCEEVKEFVSVNKRMPSQKSQNSKERFLGMWIVTQRQLHKKGGVSDDRRQSMESITGWTWDDGANSKWKIKYASVSEFVGKNGKLPSKSESKSLWAWITNQRTAYKKGSLSKEKICLLEKIIMWKWNSEGKWDEKYAIVVDFINKNGRFPSHVKTKEEEKLSGWVQKQRMDKKGGKISNYRIKKLEAIKGWKWDHDLDKMWNDTYSKLKIFLKENKRFPYQGKYPKENNISEDEMVLTRWLSAQKSNHNEGVLSVERTKLLSEIEGWYWNTEDKWMDVFVRLKSFLSNHKRFPAKRAKDADEKSLMYWVTNNKRRYRLGKRDKKRDVLLASLPGWKWSEK